MKRVLVIHYSQTGQLSALLDRIVVPLQAAGMVVDHLPLRPATPLSVPVDAPHLLQLLPRGGGPRPRAVGAAQRAA
ncbi:MAG: hypothetical protein IPO79_09445 [Flavobacteriales bacterium]|nr:hypothetical protein [Flavobacteriales bacterium]